MEQLIQQWIAIDDQLQQANEKARQLREQKNAIAEQLNEHVAAKQMQNITIRVGNERLRFAQVKETQPLTFRYLETCLQKILDGDEEQLVAVMEYIKKNRESKMVMEIKRSNK
jgi:hypothetical protein